MTFYNHFISKINVHRKSFLVFVLYKHLTLIFEFFFCIFGFVYDSNDLCSFCFERRTFRLFVIHLESLLADSLHIIFNNSTHPRLNSLTAEVTANSIRFLDTNNSLGHFFQMQLCKVSLAFWVFAEIHHKSRSSDANLW